MSHSVDNLAVSVDSGVHTFDPAAIGTTVVTAGVRVVGLAVLHGFVAAIALGADAVGAVTMSIRDAHGAVVHEGVRREDELDLPVSVGSGEELLFELSVLVDVLSLDED